MQCILVHLFTEELTKMPMEKKIALKSIKLSNGETIGYRESGSGEQTIILIHGNMTSSKHWEILMVNFDDRYKIYGIDLRGFGMSSYVNPINSLKDFSEDIKLFVDSLGLSNFVLVGWSTGGGVAMQFASDYPEKVSHLILVESVGIKGFPLVKKDTNLKPLEGKFLKTKEEIANDSFKVIPVLKAYENKDKKFFRDLWNLIIYTQKQPSEDLYQEYLEDMLTQRNYVDVLYALTTFNLSHQNNGIVEGTGDVDKIIAPTLVIQGDKDYVVSLEMAKEIVAEIGDNANLIILENTGHSPMVDNLEKLKSLVLEFIKSPELKFGIKAEVI